MPSTLSSSSPALYTLCMLSLRPRVAWIAAKLCCLATRSCVSDAADPPGAAGLALPEGERAARTRASLGSTCNQFVIGLVVDMSTTNGFSW